MVDRYLVNTCAFISDIGEVSRPRWTWMIVTRITYKYRYLKARGRLDRVRRNAAHSALSHQLGSRIHVQLLYCTGRMSSKWTYVTSLTCASQPEDGRHDTKGIYPPWEGSPLPFTCSDDQKSCRRTLLSNSLAAEVADARSLNSDTEEARRLHSEISRQCSIVGSIGNQLASLE